MAVKPCRDWFSVDKEGLAKIIARRNKGFVINGRLGHAWFKPDNILGINKLLIHEYAHEYEADHLPTRYHESLCLIGARLLRAALENPKQFEIKSGREA